MRILHFCSAFSLLSETFIYDYVAELERQGLDNHVATFERRNTSDRPFPKVHVAPAISRWHPARHWYRAYTTIMARNRDIYTWPIIRRRLGVIVRAVGPDVIHAHFGTAGFLISSIAQSQRIPLVVTFYGHDISSVPREAAWQHRYRELWRRASGVTVLSQHMKAKAMALGCTEGKLHVVHLARALAVSAVAPQPVPVTSFICVGRLVEKKGHADAIRAFAHLSPRRSGLRFDIVGEGPLMASLLELARSEGIADAVRLHGALPNPAVIAMMRDAGAFVLCSTTASDGDEEGTPTVLIEAQALGLPCVTTDHAGISEVIAPENHWLLAPEGNVAEIARRMELLLQLSPEALAATIGHGRRHVQAHFDLPAEAGKLVRIYAATRNSSVPQ